LFQDPLAKFFRYLVVRWLHVAASSNLKVCAAWVLAGF
jgi:hypothetical protein